MQTNDAILLTPRQRDCLRLVLEHMQSKEIARKLGISPHTVDQHIAAAVLALRAGTRVEAARRLAAAEADTPHRLGTNSGGIGNDCNAADGRLDFEGPGDAVRIRHSAPAVLQDSANARWMDDRPGHPQRGGKLHDLTASQKLVWIAILALGMTAGFGGLIAGLDALTRLITGRG